MSGCFPLEPATSETVRLSVSLRLPWGPGPGLPPPMGWGEARRFGRDVSGGWRLGLGRMDAASSGLCPALSEAGSALSALGRRDHGPAWKPNA